MADLFHPIEYAFMRALLSNTHFPDFNDDLCDMRLDDTGDTDYFDRQLQVQLISGTPNDISTWNTVQEANVTLQRAGTHTVVNSNSIVLTSDSHDISAVALLASGMLVAYGTVKRPKMLKFGAYTIMPGDIQFSVDGLVSDAFLDLFLSQVFLQEEPDPFWTGPGYNVFLGLFEGAPNDYDNAQPIVGISVPNFQYGPSGFYNTAPVIFTGSSSSPHTVTHAVLYWQFSQGPGTPSAYGWFVGSPLSRPVPIYTGVTIRFEPGDLMVHMI